MPGPDHKAYKGWRGTIAAALQHHPDKFSKEACGKKIKGKLCPYAIFTKKKEEGDTPHYKEQPETETGTPKKKAEFKDEVSFADYVSKRDLVEAKRKKKMDGGFLNGSFSIP
jgi:hypothetical protein